MNKIGLFVKTYATEKTSVIRINIIEELFISLKNNVDSNIIKILIVDSSSNDYHKQIIDKYTNIFNEIIYNDINKGISACQNIGIRHLIYKYDIDIGFCCDDDIIIHKNGINKYVEAIINSNIPHFCYYPYKELTEAQIIDPNYFTQEIYTDNILIIQNGISGCFLSFTKSMIEKTGYFPKLYYNYGYEHEIFTYNYFSKKICFDIISNNSKISNSEKYIELNTSSIQNKSFNEINYEFIEKNSIKAEIYKKNLGHYISYYDGTDRIQVILFMNDYNIDYIIEYILSSTYLNFVILIINNNNSNIDKYLNKLYIKIIDSNIDIKTYLNNIQIKTYLIQKIDSINNPYINFINFIDDANEFKNKRIINKNL
jgi:hypothetical protein